MSYKVVVYNTAAPVGTEPCGLADFPCPPVTDGTAPLELNGTTLSINLPQLLSMLDLKNCAGVKHETGASFPSCAEFNAGLLATFNAAIAAIIPTVCTNADDISACLISSQATNILAQGADGKLFVPPGAVDINVANFSYSQATHTITLTETDGTVHNINIADLVNLYTVVSTQAGNLIHAGADTGAYLSVIDLLNALCANAAVLAACLVSSGAGNQLTTGPDGKLFVPPAVALPDIHVASLNYNSLTGALTVTETSGADYQVLLPVPSAPTPEVKINAFSFNPVSGALVITETAGGATWSVTIPPVVDVNVQSMVYNAGTNSIVLTETDGTIHLVALPAGMVDTQVSNFTYNPANHILTITESNGDISSVDLSTLFQVIVSPNADNIISADANGSAYLTAVAVVAAVCGSNIAITSLAACLISTDANNCLVQGTDGKLFVNCVAAPTPTANLAIVKTASTNNVVVGVDLTYTLTISNAGPDAANGAVITDNLPVNFVVTGGAWTYSGGAAGGSGSAPTFGVATLPSGGGAVRTIIGHYTAVGSYTNSASIAPPAGVTDPVLANNSSSAAPTVVTAAPVFNPSATVSVASGQAESAVSIVLGGASNPGCGTPGITSASWVIKDAGAVTVATGTNLPGTIVEDLAGFTGPFTITYQVTDLCGTSAVASTTFTVLDCAATAAAFTDTARHQYYTHTSNYNSAGIINTMINVWGIPSANSNIPSAGHTRLGQAAYPDIMSGLSLGVPSLKPAALASSIVTSASDTSVAALDPQDLITNAEMGIITGSLYADCNQVAGTTFKFRAYAGSANAECYCGIWDGSGPAAANTATDDSYSLTTLGTVPVVQTETVPFAITGPLHRFGFALFNIDSGGSNDSRLQVSKNGGAFIDLRTLAEIAAAGLVLNNL